MKNIAALFLVSIYLFSATDLKELLRVEVVIEHLHEHQKNDSSVSLYQFLVMHYITDDHDDKDNERDMQLPFKPHDTSVSNISFVSIFSKFRTANFYTYGIETNAYFQNRDSIVITSFQDHIWHPPQLNLVRFLVPFIELMVFDRGCFIYLL